MSNSSDYRRLYALIVGIDEYTIGAPKLMGAVADAAEIRGWVINTLHVPTERVQVLCDTEATREAIIQALKALATNDEIESGDPILIYYAGHGTEGPTPKGWRWDSPTIQMILPYDYKHKHAVTRKIVQGIPDRTLGFLISEISKKKGDNITVIFDCCNSGSGTRATLQGARIRGVQHEGQIPEKLDDEYLPPPARGAQEIPQFRYHGLQSHVLLAACAPNERAHENNRSGRFTAALLRALSTADLFALTYEGLIDSLDIESQTPQCEGVNRGRNLFNKKVPNTNAIFEARLSRSQLTIQGAGSIQGIEVGCTFSVWNSRADIKGQPLDVVTVQNVSTNSSTATWKPAKRSDFVVQLTGNPNFKLPVHVPKVIQALPFYKELFIDTQSKIQSFEPASKDGATIGLIRTESGRIGFEMLNVEEKNQVITQTALPDVDELRRALQHISNYYYHRNRANLKPPMVGERPDLPSFSSYFSLEVYQVSHDRNAGDSDEVSPADVRIGPNLNVEGDVVVTIKPGKDKPDKDDMYGFKIQNRTKKIDVYPYLFYFDSSTFSISCIYSPTVVTHSKDPGPLQRENSLTIGYGSSGLPPQYLFLSNKNLDYERGYLRVYLSTKYVDLSSIIQGDLLGVKTRGVKPVPLTLGSFWDSITIPVTIKRGVIPAPPHMIGVIGSRGSGKDKFLEALFKSLHGHEGHKPIEYSLVKEYRLNLTEPKQPIAIVDLPGLQNEDIDQQLKALKAIATYAINQYAQRRKFISLIWCYNISSSPNLTAEAAINWDFVKDIAGREMLKNTVILTTGWNTTTRPGPPLASGIASLHPHTKLEQELEKSCEALVAEGAKFKRLSPSEAEKVASGDRFVAPLALVTSLLGKEPLELQVQREIRHKKKLSAATAWRPLSIQINKTVQDLEEELKGLEEGDDDVDEITGEIKKWKTTLEEIGKPMPGLL